MRSRLTADLSFLLVTLVGLGVFTWPFFVDAATVTLHGKDAPWLFAVLMGLLALVVMAETAADGLEAKTVAVLGVLSALGGALRLLSGGTAGLEPMFFIVVVAGRVLGRSMGFLVGALSILVGALLTGAVGPWMPFQMFAAGWVAVGASMLPPLGRQAERLALAAYGLVAGLLYGLAMNLWFWPFGTMGMADGTGFVPGADIATNLAHYAAFYTATSFGWDFTRGTLTALLVLLGGPPVLASLRRAVRRAAFGVESRFGGSAT